MDGGHTLTADGAVAIELDSDELAEAGRVVVAHLISSRDISDTMNCFYCSIKRYLFCHVVVGGGGVHVVLLLLQRG